MIGKVIFLMIYIYVPVAIGMSQVADFEKCLINGIPTIETGEDYLIAKIPQNTSPLLYETFFDVLSEQIRTHENLVTVELGLSFMHRAPTEIEWEWVVNALAMSSRLTTCKVSFYRYLFNKSLQEDLYLGYHYGYSIPSFLFPKLFEALDRCPDFTTFKLGACGLHSSCAMPENFLNRDEINLLLSSMGRSSHLGVFILDGRLLEKMKDATLALFSQKLKLCGDKVHFIVESPKHYSFKSPEIFCRNVQKCDAIKSVCFRNSGLRSLTKKDCKKMFEVLAQCRHIECIDITGHNLNEDVIEEMCALIPGIRVVGVGYDWRYF